MNKTIGLHITKITINTYLKKFFDQGAQCALDITPSLHLPWDGPQEVPWWKCTSLHNPQKAVHSHLEGRAHGSAWSLIILTSKTLGKKENKKWQLHSTLVGCHLRTGMLHLVKGKMKHSEIHNCVLKGKLPLAQFVKVKVKAQKLGMRNNVISQLVTGGHCGQ